MAEDTKKEEAKKNKISGVLVKQKLPWEQGKEL